MVAPQTPAFVRLSDGRVLGTPTPAGGGDAVQVTPGPSKKPAEIERRTVIVEATPGAMGGAGTEEFLYPSPVGEDTFVRTAGGYAANVEAVTTVAPEPVDWSGIPAAHVEPTPDTPTIATLVDASNELQPR